MSLLRALVAVVGAASWWAAAGIAQGNLQPVPALTARVTDLTGTLTEVERDSLERSLAALEQTKGAQVAVLLVKTTEPEDIAAYGIRVAEAWQLGRKGTDDGAIVIVALADRRVRIEVGRGLEGAIPDAASARVIREYLTPRFREGDYYGGIRDAVIALTRLINDEPLPAPLTDEPGDHGLEFGGIQAALIAAWFAAMALRAVFGRLPGLARGSVVGMGAGGIAWLVSGLLPLGVIAGVLGLFFGLVGRGGGGWFVGRGGWGGFGGGGWGGTGRRGGGFRGRGGGFAGGGASGKW